MTLARRTRSDSFLSKPLLPVGVALLVFLIAGGWVCDGLAAAVEYDLSTSLIQNGDAEAGLSGWQTDGAVSVQSDGSASGRCFQLVVSDQPAVLQTPLLPVRRGEAVRLNYRLKADIQPTAAVILRHWAADGQTPLSQIRLPLEQTGGRWRQQSHHITSDPKAYFVDVRFVLNPSASSSASVLVDDVVLFREIRYEPMYADIQPLSANDTLYVFTKGPDRENNQFVAIQTLQGVAARTDRPRLWIDVGDDAFVRDLERRYQIQFDWSMARDWAGLMKTLKPYTSGRYVLYSMRDRASLSAAATLAGILDAVAVDTDLEQAVIDLGYTQAVDVRGKDGRWVFEKYRGQINDNLIIVHTNDPRFHRSAYHLKDWPAATQALSWWDNDEALSRRVFGSMAPCSPVYGWLNPVTDRDEGLAVRLHSEEGLFQIPSDWMVNLSVHASMGRALKDKSFRQIAPRQSPITEEDVHYVTFIMSDMDNILTEIGTHSFYSTRKFYRNPHRGEFPMTWGMAPSLVELSPNGVAMWYRDATPNDVFIAYCGLGYSYNSVSPYLQTHAKRLGEWMERADLRVLLLIDYVLPHDTLDDSYYESARWFTALEQVEGLIYLEYIQYAPHDGKILWFDGKPMVTARFDFRRETFYPAVRPTAAALAESINALPADPSRPDGYTAVTVHAWSKGMDDIAEVVGLLDDNVRVVDAETFIRLIRRNLKP